MSETKNRGGRPRIDAVPVTVRVPPELLAHIDTFAASEPDTPSRPEALRRIVRDWLVGHGYMPLDGG